MQLILLVKKVIAERYNVLFVYF